MLGPCEICRGKIRSDDDHFGNCVHCLRFFCGKCSKPEQEGECFSCGNLRDIQIEIEASARNLEKNNPGRNRDLKYIDWY